MPGGDGRRRRGGPDEGEEEEEEEVKEDKLDYSHGDERCTRSYSPLATVPPSFVIYDR